MKQQQTTVEWIIEEINQQQKRYIDLAKKDKSFKKEVDAILTATTLLKMKCDQAKEMEKEQLKKVWMDAQTDQCKQFSSNYSGITFDEYLEIYKKEKGL